MRISTSTLYAEGVAAMNQMQSGLARTQLQIASGQRMQSPADDPVAAARVIEISQSDAANSQFASNRIAAINSLSLEEGILSSVTEVVQYLKERVAEAGNPNQTATSLASMASDLKGRMQELLGLANSSDGKGNYFFSGGQGNVKPFVETAGGVAYQGDDVPRLIQVAASRQMNSTDSGADIFMRIRAGNGSFQTAAAAGNTGSGLISQGQVITPPYDGKSYQVVFTGPTTFDVNDVSGGAPVAVLTAQPYVSGQAINVGGVQFEIKGTPATGDTFDIQPSANQSVFDALVAFIATVETPPVTGNAASQADFQQGLQQAAGALDQVLSNVLAVRASVGGRLRELDALQASGEELGLQYQQTLSRLRDTDYLKAVTDLNQQQLALQASQQAFAKVSKMSLFDYL